MIIFFFHQKRRLKNASGRSLFNLNLEKIFIVDVINLSSKKWSFTSSESPESTRNNKTSIDALEETTGPPVDFLDRSCKNYKSCQFCVQEAQGSSCAGELVKYSWSWNEAIFDLDITEPSGSCEREIGECDKKFVKDLFEQRFDYNPSYNAKKWLEIQKLQY